MAKIKPKELFKAYKDKVSFIDDYLAGYDKELAQLERELAMMIVGDYLPKFATKDGFIILNEKNAKLLKELDKVFAEFKEQFATGFFKKTGEAMLKLTALSSNYYRALNFPSKTLKNIADKLEKMTYTIGIDPKTGNVLPGSFIDNLASTPQTKSLLSDYVRKGIEGEVPYKNFVSGFRGLVEGSKDVKGSMVRYTEGYVKQAMFSHSRAIDSFAADELNLNCFYYAGSLIKTSRDFCIERAGKIFTREEVESWNDLDWDGKIPGGDIFVDVGGYGPCRHNLMPIPCEGLTEEEMKRNDNLE